MTQIAKVEITLFNDSPDYYENDPNAFDGLLRVDTVHLYSKEGKPIQDYELLVQNDRFFNWDFCSADELIDGISTRLKVSPKIVEII